MNCRIKAREANRESRFFQIFREGRHIAMSGTALSFSAIDLEKMATLFNCGHCAPLYLGHPKGKMPSFGEVVKVVADKGKLFANALVEPDLIGLVRSGYYKKVSASFVPQEPFGWLLDHVAFLGAQPPAVKGMDNPDFGEMHPQSALCFADKRLQINISS